MTIETHLRVEGEGPGGEVGSNSQIVASPSFIKTEKQLNPKQDYLRNISLELTLSLGSQKTNVLIFRI